MSDSFDNTPLIRLNLAVAEALAERLAGPLERMFRTADMVGEYSAQSCFAQGKLGLVDEIPRIHGTVLGRLGYDDAHYLTKLARVRARAAFDKEAARLKALIQSQPDGVQ